MTYKAVLSSSDAQESLNRAAVIHYLVSGCGPADLGCRVKGLPALLPGPRSVSSLRHRNLGSLGSNDLPPSYEGTSRTNRLKPEGPINSHNCSGNNDSCTLRITPTTAAHPPSQKMLFS